MLFADSQDSCTQMQGASLSEKTAMTCGNGSILGDFVTSPHQYSATAIHHYSATPLHAVRVSGSVAALSCPVDGRQVVHDAYRLVVLESLLPKMRTEKGRVTFMRRWLGVPDGHNEADTAQLIAERLSSSEDRVAEVMSWVGHVEKVGSSLAVPAPPPPPGRWQGEAQWVRGAAAALARSTSRRLRRVGAQHREVILQALAGFADRGTGCGVTASNRTIGAKAAELCRLHIKRGGGWRGRRTDDLSERTLHDHVGCVVAALIDAGWMRERARGRKLTAFERVEAWARFRIFQTQAASVRDLVVPEESRVVVPRGRRLGWRSAVNPSAATRVVSGLVECIGRLVQYPVLRTYPSLARLSFYLHVLGKYLTRKNASAEASPTSRRRKTRPEPPSLPAQRLVAHLLDVMPWLQRSRTVGKRIHSWTLARIADRTGLADLNVDAVLAHIDGTLREKHWELRPELIRNPLAWFTVVAKQVTGARE